MKQQLLKSIDRIYRFASLWLKRISLPGYKGFTLFDLISLYWSGLIKGALSSRASAIAFSLFTALFPLLIFLLTLMPHLFELVQANASYDLTLFRFLEAFLPEATADYFSQIFTELKEKNTGTLLSSTFVLSIFLVVNGVNSIFSEFAHSYHVAFTRNFFKQYLYSFAVGVSLALGVSLGTLGFVYSEWYLNQLSMSTDFFSARLLQRFLVVFVIFLAAASLYFFGTARKARTSFFSWGPLMTTVLIVITSYFFGIYVDEFASYNELYGALGGLLILMFYLWLNSNILLLGYELNVLLARFKRGEDPSATA
jgi:membrane protein